MIGYRITAQDPGTDARCGQLTTNHYEISTPNFMPVATQATVKTLSPEDLRKIGCEIIVCNTYHLMLRPSVQLIKTFGGLHRFMGWDRAILTDSGGFQAYSLHALRKVTDEGIEFSSHLDGSRYFLNPEKVVTIQNQVGADIAMCLDVFTAYPSQLIDTRIAVERTIKWAKQSLKVKKKQPLFAIVQGATFKELRRECAQRLVDLNFPGYAIGGLMIGEPFQHTSEMVNEVNQILPKNKVRYLMGCGYPEDILEAVGLGVDLFDCVLPTRNGRTGMAFTSAGKVIIKASRYAHDRSPLDERCHCNTCRHFSRAYLRHLFNAGEMLGQRLVSYHNIHFYINLMKTIRRNIRQGRFRVFKEQTRKHFNFRED